MKRADEYEDIHEFYEDVKKNQYSKVMKVNVQRTIEGLVATGVKVEFTISPDDVNEPDCEMVLSSEGKHLYTTQGASIEDCLHTMHINEKGNAVYL